MSNNNSTPNKKNMSTTPNKKYYDDFVSSMVSHSQTLKEQEHRRRMEMAQEEHAIKMAIHKEKLRCVILEREILELRKMREEAL